MFIQAVDRFLLVLIWKQQTYTCIYSNIEDKIPLSLSFKLRKNIFEFILNFAPDHHYSFNPKCFIEKHFHLQYP